MKTSGAILLLVVAAMLALTGCGGLAASATPRPPLRVSFAIWPGLYPLVIAEQQGFFARHGVPVQVVVYDAYTSTYADFAAGKVDGAEMVIGDLLLLLEKHDSTIVMTTDSSEGGDQVVAANDIHSVADLKGKRIGVRLGTYGELFVRKMLEANGLTPADVTFVNTNPEAVPAVFPGQIDAGHSFEPFTSQAVAKGGHVVFTSAQTPGLIPNVFAFSANVVKERPADVRAFVAAWFEAVDWMNAHPDEVPGVVAKGTGLKADDIWMGGGDRVFTLADTRAAFTPGTDYRSLYFTSQEYVKFLTASGSLNTSPELDKLIDASFVR